MFRCQICRSVVPPRTPAQRIVLKRRPKKYRYRPMANTVVVHEPGKKPKREYRDDPGGAGHEIVQEAVACPSCARAFAVKSAAGVRLAC